MSLKNPPKWDAFLFYSKQRIRLCKVFYERDFLFDSFLIPYRKNFFAASRYLEEMQDKTQFHYLLSIQKEV